MQLDQQQANRLARDGVQALQQGRGAEARRIFQTLTAAGRADGQIWLLLAIACRVERDPVAEETALDALLKLDPQSIRGLIMKADCRLRAGDEQLANQYYKQALYLGSNQDLPEADHAELRRAQAASRPLDERRTARLEALLAEQGLAPEQCSARFRQSLDIMAGRKQIYYQEPSGYYFPELPNIQFYDPVQFGWAPAVEAATDLIRDELRALLSDDRSDFRPYIRSEADQPRRHPLLDNQDWSALFLCENGRRFEDAIARCPKTWEILQSVPLPWIEGAAPTIMFSLLRAGTRIPAHRGVLNTRLICHLPLIVPPGCGFRVGNDTHPWHEGKLIVFDDTIEHEAWNESDQDRIVLIFDIWRPELGERERAEVSALYTLADMLRDQGGA